MVLKSLVMAKIHRVTWDKRGPAAISAAAFGVTFDVREPEAVVDDNGVAVVEICGPLVQYSGFQLDGYDSIECRVQAAFASQARTVVLSINSPGGDVYGNLECARAIRAMADASGKKLITYVDGQASSAAYALACAADEIHIPETGSVGSIGVVDTIASIAKRNEAMGIDIQVITSGARKADGNPNVAITDAARAVREAHVDELAGILFSWVSERRNLSTDAVKAFEAGSFTGASAVSAGLADSVSDFHKLRENLAHGTNTATAQRVPEAKNLMASPKSSKYTDCMASLATLAEEGDEHAIAALKKMASSKSKADDAAPASDAPPADDKKSAPPPAEKKAEAPAALAAVAATPNADVDALTEIAKLRNEIAAEKDKAERATLLASRPDLSADPKMKGLLDRMATDVLKDAVKNIPVVGLTGAPAVAQATRGEGQGGPGSALPADLSEALKRQMGLSPHPVATTARVGFTSVFGATPEQIKEIQAGTIRNDKDGK